MKGSSLMYAIR